MTTYAQLGSVQRRLLAGFSSADLHPRTSAEIMKVGATAGSRNENPGDRSKAGPTTKHEATASVSDPFFIQRVDGNQLVGANRSNADVAHHGRVGAWSTMAQPGSGKPLPSAYSVGAIDPANTGCVHNLRV